MNLIQCFESIPVIASLGMAQWAQVPYMRANGLNPLPLSIGIIR